MFWSFLFCEVRQDDLPSDGEKDLAFIKEERQINRNYPSSKKNKRKKNLEQKDKTRS